MSTLMKSLKNHDLPVDEASSLLDAIYPFSSGRSAALDQVGGKAMSLIHMTRHGLPVPPGFVLSVAFFKPWLEEILSQPAWRSLLESPAQEMKLQSEEVKKLCMQLEFNRPQKTALLEALETLCEQSAPQGVELFAVRSSSPEEDLEELSFAGGYQTTLGVPLEEIEKAIRVSFASCFDARVIAYKRENNLPVDTPRIAVIVQQQIASEAAGVAFSLNPLNNCYDEAVINANFGLGESVVSGQVSPDMFLVDRVKGALIEKRAGAKETAIWLGSDGGTYESPPQTPRGYSLNDEQALAVSGLLDVADDYYARPIDIEWTFAGGKLFLLQARPITAYVPLPPELTTAPGEPKRLYADLTLTKWGMPDPLSVMGMVYMDLANYMFLSLTLGAVDMEGVRAVRPSVGGRTYVNLSNSLKFQGKDRMVGTFRFVDALVAETIKNLDESQYLPEKLPPQLNGIVRKMIFKNIGTIWQGLKALRNPERYRQDFLRTAAELEQVLEGYQTPDSSMQSYAEATMNALINYMLNFIAVFIANEIARSNIKRMFKNQPADVQEKLTYLERALPNNITIEMGLAMYHLASYAEIRDCPSGAVFAERLAQQAFSPEFHQAWEDFMDKFGFRGPMEMDPAAIRFYEQPGQFFEQLRPLADNRDPENNPQAVYERACLQRENAYKALYQLLESKGKRQVRRFEKNYQVLTSFGGYRETPKYYYVWVVDMFRRRVLAAAKDLVAAGRLDNLQQVFDLSISDLDRAIANPDLDLHPIIEKNTRTLRKVKGIKEFPRVIDSRGKILRPPKKEVKEGELAGEPIAPGVTRGPVKVLNAPNEKPVRPGDILVTRATDPGWTPLFINAAGVILEVGGVLQHGALVAREYGKPCIAGIENAASILKDGQIVEIDGANGIVRLLENEPLKGK